MSFPTIATPSYTFKVPSTQETIKFRPYTVGEEKLLMIAVESDSMTELTNALEQIIDRCTFGVLNSSNMTAFDMEYLFAQLRAKSVGETSDVGLKCSGCSRSNPVQIDLTKARVDNMKHDREDFLIQADENVYIKLRYPVLKDTFYIMNNLEELTPTEIAYKNIVSAIDEVYVGDEVYSAKETTRENLEKFIDSLKPSTFQEIKKLLDEIPNTVIDLTFTCKHCSLENNYRATGIINFFA